MVQGADIMSSKVTCEAGLGIDHYRFLLWATCLLPQVTELNYRCVKNQARSGDGYSPALIRWLHYHGTTKRYL